MTAQEAAGFAPQESQDPGFLPKAQKLSAQALQDGSRSVQDAASFAHAVHQISVEGRASVRRGMEERPYLILGTAATVGLILGRGSSFSLNRSLLGMGGKLVMSLVLKRITSNIL